MKKWVAVFDELSVSCSDSRNLINSFYYGIFFVINAHQWFKCKCVLYKIEHDFKILIFSAPINKYLLTELVLTSNQFFPVRPFRSVTKHTVFLALIFLEEHYNQSLRDPTQPPWFFRSSVTIMLFTITHHFTGWTPETESLDFTIQELFVVSVSLVPYHRYHIDIMFLC